ncbi:MAG: sulfatase-like hydrolase/transferase, partial [Planctomycetes bacterium]|nr:sulfatase-like hydrolase/transferase [Planctomycetota bacterium]
EKLGAHKPAGPWRGGKSSLFEGGTRVPFLVRWPAAIAAGAVSDATFSQIDMLASLAALCGAKVPQGATPDGRDHSPALLGTDRSGREVLVQQAGGLAVRKGPWKYIEPRNGPARFPNTNTESGNAPKGQLFNLKEDPGETDNRIAREPVRAKEMAKLLESIRGGSR